MTPAEERENAIIEAALRLAARRSWRDVRLSDIAAEANLDLADLAQTTSSKADIVRRFSRRTDRATARLAQEAAGRRRRP
jgi:ubiquinone biosynthesis protein COQ9